MLFNEKQKIRTLKNLKDKFWNKNSVDEVNNKTDLAQYQVNDAQDQGERISSDSEHKVHLQVQSEGHLSNRSSIWERSQGGKNTE